MTTFSQQLDEDLARLRDSDRLRACPNIESFDRTRVRRGDQALLSFASNDYLGLSSHPALPVAADAAARLHGFGAGAARLVSGDLPPHQALEAALATYLRARACLVFPTGYQTNLGVLTALAGSGDLIVSDAANHASIIDGCRLSRATVRVYSHLDVQAARAALRAPGPYRRRLLVTESLFSMDGDFAPLSALASATAESGAALIVDEAHALGVMGPGGRGLCAEAGVVPDVLIGTLGKAVGSFGGFAAGSETVRSTLVNRARTFIFTTALPPPVVAATLASLALVAGTEGDQRRARLLQNIGILADALSEPGPGSSRRGPIFPLVLGTDRRALDSASALAAAGYFVPAIRPPTVPEGTARLRVTLSADHGERDVVALSETLKTLRAA